ncbi:MAG: Fic family protein [Segetibacter sp.]|nr:Fic family protein [Segetibacter sp.]
MSMTRVQEILIGSKERSKEIKKLLKQNLIRKIAPRLYTTNMREEPEKIVKRNWYNILSELFPEAFLSHRSALERMPTLNGHIYLTNTYKDNIALPGLTIHFIEGPAPIHPDDALFFGNTRVSGLARAYLENLQSTRGKGDESKILGREQLEEKMEAFIRVKGEEALNQVKDRAKEIAPQLNMEKEMTLLNSLISDLLGTGFSKNLTSKVARARVLGEPFDPDRIELFGSLYAELVKKDYPDYIDKNNTTQSYQNFAFFESYFSNYIEGTEFTVDEAKQIIMTSMPLPARDEDSHDILGTYEIVSNREEMSIQPKNENGFLQLMKQRHARLLSARTSKNPGELKDRNNRAGNTEFVDCTLVTGTLKKGFEWYGLLQHPFAKAAYMMFMVSEVHPFLDGNGRIARVMMNVELAAKGLSKIIIPTVYREDYMLSLKKLTKEREGDAYIRMLLRAWEFSSTIHNNDLELMEKYLSTCNAFSSPKEGILKYSLE